MGTEQLAEELRTLQAERGKLLEKAQELQRQIHWKENEIKTAQASPTSDKVQPPAAKPLHEPPALHSPKKEKS